MSRNCSCGQDIDVSMEPVRLWCGCVCGHVRNKPCKMHWEMLRAGIQRDFGFQWKQTKEIIW